MTVNDTNDEYFSCVWIENGHLCDADQIHPDALCEADFLEPLVGDYFLSLKEDGAIEWQGQVLAVVPDSSLYQVELLSWITGDPVERRVVSIDQMKDWRFYENIEQLGDGYRALKKETN